MSTEDCYTSSVTLPATGVLFSASSARITNKPYYYYSHPVLCAVAKSNATVGHQFIAWFSGKALWRAEGFFSLCSLAADQEPDMARNSWHKELNVGMFGGVGSRRKGFFFSLQINEIWNVNKWGVQKCWPHYLFVITISQKSVLNNSI